MVLPTAINSLQKRKVVQILSEIQVKEKLKNKSLQSSALHLLYVDPWSEKTVITSLERARNPTWLCLIYVPHNPQKKGYSLNWWIWAWTWSSQTCRSCLYSVGETLYEQRFSTACSKNKSMRCYFPVIKKRQLHLSKPNPLLHPSALL